MTSTLDRSVTTVPQPPPTTPFGPDRLLTNLAIDLGAGAFATLPQGATMSLLPVAGNVSLVGVPALDGTLATAAYNLTAAAVSGQDQSPPISVVQGIETTDANDPVTVGGFLPVPALVQPGPGTWSGTHVDIQASGPIDLSYITISSGAGLVIWQIVAPGRDRSFDLPDLSKLADVGRLVHGPIASTLTIARLTSFDYGTLRTGQLATPAWNAYAQVTQSGAY
jgi:hypothetical protein